MKMILISLLLLALAAAGAAGYFLCQAGAAPDAEQLKQFERLAYFKNGRFTAENDVSVHPEKMTGGSTFSFFSVKKYAPDTPLPQKKLDKNSFPQTPGELAVYWLGHSSFILEIGARRIILDPVLGNAAPLPGLFKRYGQAPITREDFPPADIVLITHNHYDHLERASVRALAKRGAAFVVPLGVGAALKSWGVKAQHIHELGWNDTFTQNGLTITAQRAEHYSSRRGTDKNKTLWNGYTLEAGGRKIYVSGDTGYNERLFKEIGRRHGPFDAALVEIDAWNPGWPGMHLFPAQAVRAVQDVNAKQLIPAHWGVFNLGLHRWDESIRAVQRLADENNVRVSAPVMGEWFEPGKTLTRRWWENLN